MTDNDQSLLPSHKQHHSYHNQDDEDHLHYLFLHLYTKIEERVNGYSHGYKKHGRLLTIIIQIQNS